jgi:hypothetical protein
MMEGIAAFSWAFALVVIVYIEIEFIKDRIVELERYQKKGVKEIAFPQDSTFSIKVMKDVFEKTLKQNKK